MSNELTIEQKNEAIALFDGWEKYEDSDGIWFKKAGRNHPKWEDLKYHASWDWLMPVVEKINPIWVNSVRSKQLEIEETYRAMQNRILLCSILETVEHVYQFIQWLNQQKQTHETR